MSEQLDTKSLVGMASQKGAVSRESPDARTKSASSQATRKGGFDGFLKSFIDKDKTGGSASAASTQQSRQSSAAKSRRNKNSGGSPSLAGSLETKKSGSGKSGQAASNMTPAEKRSLRRAMEKTVAAESAPAEDAAALADDGEVYAGDAFADYADIEAMLAAGVLVVTPEVAAAAEEAARLIWDLVYGTGDASESMTIDAPAEGMGDAMAKLAGLINAMKQGAGNGGGDALAGMGATNIDAEAVAEAIETANASAEMNNAAVLSALEDLLDGMPRQALEDALAKTARELGLDVQAQNGGKGLFDEIAKALGLEIVGVENSGAEGADVSRLLAELTNSASSQEIESAARTETVSKSAAEPAEAVEGENASPALPQAAEEMSGDERLVDVYAESDAPDAAVGTQTASSSSDNASPATENTATNTAVPAADTANAVPAASDSPEKARVVEEGLGKDLPVAESAASVETERQKDVMQAAETSGAVSAETKILGMLEQFLKEKAEEISLEGPINNSSPVTAETAEELVDAFVDWAMEQDNSSEMAVLLADREQLVSVMHTALTMLESDNTESNESLDAIFSWVRKNLESILQTGTDMKVEKAPETVKNLAGALESDPRNTAPAPQQQNSAARETGGGQESLAQNASAATQGAQVNQATTPTATTQTNQERTSAMLDQIQNIERLTEAMRMANRGGVKNLTLQLSPPELGKVLLRVEARDGLVSAYLRVEKPEAAAQLANNLSQLRENLKAQGIELGELDIRQQSQNQAMTDFGGHRHRRNNEADGGRDGFGGRSSGYGDDDEDAGGAAEAVRSNRDANGNLNLFA